VGINKLIKNLQNQLSKGEKKGKASLDRIDDLLGELKQKEKKLEHKLDNEKNSSERKHLKLELKIVRVQLKKGKARRAELAKKYKK
jgi:Skp family chaperone for outer membrane proteins